MGEGRPEEEREMEVGREAALHGHIEKLISAPFDLAADYKLRAEWIGLDKGSHSGQRLAVAMINQSRLLSPKLPMEKVTNAARRRRDTTLIANAIVSVKGRPTKTVVGVSLQDFPGRIADVRSAPEAVLIIEVTLRHILDDLVASIQIYI
jgi:hypothetical protein